MYQTGPFLKNQMVTGLFFSRFYDFQKNEYIYQYKDHLDNARVTYNKNMQFVDTNNYYPFEMNHLRDDSSSNFGQGSYKNYKYNGKELHEIEERDSPKPLKTIK